MRIGWIGFKKESIDLINNLLFYGHEVYGYSPALSEMKSSIQKGLIPCDSIEKLVSNSSLIFTLLDDSDLLYKTYCKEKGIFESCALNKKRIICIDLSITSPKLTKFLASNEFGIPILDAPRINVHYENNQETLYCFPIAGEKDIYERIKNIFNCFNGKTYYVGKSGNGQIIWKANMMSLLGSLLATIECDKYLDENNIDISSIYSLFNNGLGTSYILPKYFQKKFNSEIVDDGINDILTIEEAKKNIENIVLENQNSLLSISKIIYGMMKDLKQSETIFSITKFYDNKGDENE